MSKAAERLRANSNRARKPAWRRALSGRALKLIAAKALTRVIPALSGWIGYYPGLAYAEELPGAQRLEKIRETPPRPMSEATRRFAALAGDPETPARRVAYRFDVIPDVTLFTGNGSLASPGAHAFVQHHPGEALAENAARPRLHRDGGVIEKTALTMLGVPKGHRQYYHFIVDLLQPALLYLEWFGGDAPVALLTRDDLAEHQERLIAALIRRHPNVEHMRLPDRARVRLRRSVTPFGVHDGPHPVVEPETRALLASLALPDASPAPSRGPAGARPEAVPRRRLFVSRKEAKLRLLLNEDAIMAALAPMGFERIQPGLMSHAEQVAAFAQADCVVSTHGAALTNLLYAPPGVGVVELFPENFLQTAYLWIANHGGSPYAPVIGSKGDYRQNFTADPGAVAAAAFEALGGA